MGCTQSKIENEEAVCRCKERKLFMKDAVSARNAFAAAHSAYAMCLKNTGAALSDYAQGESHQLPHPHTSSSSSAVAALPSSVASYDSPLPPPPPPLPNFPPSPLQRAVSMPEISVHKPELKRSDPIIEEENEEEIENDSHSLKHRTSRSSGGGGGSRNAVKQEDNLAPPPPTSSPPRTDRAPPPPPPPEAKGMSWDFFFPEMENVPGPSLAEVDDDGKIEREREEMERKTREEMERKAREEMERKTREEMISKKRAEEVSLKAEVAEVAEEVVAKQLPPQPPASKAVKKSKPPLSRRDGKNVNLLQTFSELDDCFLKASESAHEVSKMLEANRLHYHSNFADNRGHIDHSARVMRVITWNRSFRGLPNTDDGVDEIDSEEHETHATVLDKMLAWEKKLYDEVKTGEQMKLDYQKKVSSLNKLKKRGASTESIEKTKAALSHLHTRYIVDMQSMDSTVSEINRLRDAQLYPKLVALVDGMATMWDTMQKHHESQSKIVAELKYLDFSESTIATSEHHHDRTLQLWGVAREWHSQFVKLMTHQKEYIKALKDWLRLNLIPIDNNLKEKVSSPQKPQNPPIQSLLLAWHENLSKLPDDVARTAISNFAAVIDTIAHFQEEEMKLRDQCEETRKELIRKTKQHEEWYNKYMQRRTPPDEMDSERSQDKDLIAERQLALDLLKKRLKDEDEAYKKQSSQVRDKSLMTLKTCLPELFRAMRTFSVTCSSMYSELRSISQSHKPNETL